MRDLSVSLLGVPSVSRGGTAGLQPKGKKAWALLTYLALSDGPHTRNHLAELLFGGTDDPLGSLRWNLSQLRKILKLPEALRGSYLDLRADLDGVLDVDVLTKGTWTEAIRVRGLGCDLLEGMDFPSDPTFETWLTLERSRIRNVTRSVLREAAAASLGNGHPDMAADFAARAIALDPFNEASHELLIRAFASAGLHDKANAALARCTQLFRDELQVEPSAALRNALTEGRPHAGLKVSGPAAARAQLDLGRSALKAGAIETGIESLRAAVGAAEQSGDRSLYAESLLGLGYALLHSVRGRDGEASALLHRALGIAESVGSESLTSACLRELGYIEMLVGSYDRALVSLERALDLSGDDQAGAAWTLAYEAICHSDMGRYAKAVECLDRCLAMEGQADTASQTAYALCLLGRIQLLRGELAQARESLERSISTATKCGWTGLVPWPQSLLAEVDLLEGADPDQARVRLEHALSLAQQIGDPCWEAAALHGLGMVDAAAGAVETATERLKRASTVCVRFPDSYIWMRGYILDALCDLSTQTGAPGADQWISDLRNLAAQTGMNELLARSYLYESRSGDESAGSTARLIAREVDNPVLLSFI
ncbi:MAG: tetratricopeptide repeat protein [Actinomycetota bacterium]